MTDPVGERQFKRSLETRRRMSEAQRRRTDLRKPGEFRHSEETKRKISEAKSGIKLGPCSEETRRRISEAHSTPEARARASAEGRGKKWRGGPDANGWFIHQAGYKYLTGRYDHPLALRGQVAEHRVVLYAKIGPGSHACHWCGAQLSWGGRDGIQGDHLDDNKQNNDPENIVPSCGPCNSSRSPVDPPRGERSGTAKLTERDVRLIRQSPMSSPALAKMLGVTPGTIGKIRRRERWAHVD